MRHNPQCEYLYENLDFRDMKRDWGEVCSVLGDPYILPACRVSHTHRNRAYWTNFAHLPDTVDELPQYHHQDPNKCLYQGRKVCQYQSKDHTCVRTVNASWVGDDNHPRNNTAFPLLIRDMKHDKLQSPFPEETELLLGLPLNSTAAPGISNKLRLIAIGMGWDVNSVAMLMAHSNYVLSQHTGSRITCQSCLVELQHSLIRVQDAVGSAGLSEILFGLTPQEVKLCLNFIQCYSAQPAPSSVLDSGSARHLSNRTRVINQDDKTPLTGFDGSQQWTEGNGYLPITILDHNSNSTAIVDIWDTDLMSSDLVTQILSMGKLLRLGWSFQFSDCGKECWAFTPGNAHKVQVLLGTDDILRIPHTIRNGMDSIPMHELPTSNINALRRTIGDVDAILLHEIFNHCGSEKLYRTLLSTVGFKAVRFPEFHCRWCALTKARDFGLKQTSRTKTASVMPVHPIYNEDEDPDNGSDADDPNADELDYVAPVAGRMYGVQNVPRFDLDVLRPFEAMFADNKDFPCTVRGGAKSAFIFIDYKTRIKYKIDVTSKKNNGQAFRRIMAKFGVHKLNYPCRVFTDGCGSMAHVELAACLMGVDHQYNPPHQQSLNEAENVDDQVWASARTHMARSNAPDRLFSKCIDYVIYIDARMSTTADRDWKTPYEMVHGLKPSIAKLHRWYTAANVTAPKSKRKTLAKQGLSTYRAEPGRFIGFQSIFSSTYGVWLDRAPNSLVDRLVHSINVTFDDNDCAVEAIPQQAVSQPDINMPVRSEQR